MPNQVSQIVPPIAVTPITGEDRSILIMRNFKIYPGCYHHKITIDKNTGIVTHTYHILSTTTNGETDTLFKSYLNKNVSSLPTYNNYNTEDGESLAFNHIGSNQNGIVFYTNLFKINKCSIKTNVTA